MEYPQLFILYPYQAYDAMVIYLCNSFNACTLLYAVHSTSTCVVETFWLVLRHEFVRFSKLFGIQTNIDVFAAELVYFALIKIVLIWFSYLFVLDMQLHVTTSACFVSEQKPVLDFFFFQDCFSISGCSASYWKVLNTFLVFWIDNASSIHHISCLIPDCRLCVKAVSLWHCSFDFSRLDGCWVLAETQLTGNLIYLQRRQAQEYLNWDVTRRLDLLFFL